MSDQLSLFKKLKKLAKALAITQRRTFIADITVDERFAGLKKTIEEKVLVQGRTVKVGYYVGEYNLNYFVFGQNTDKPEESGEIDFDERFIDVGLEQALADVKKVIANNILNDAVQKKLEELGLN